MCKSDTGGDGWNIKIAYGTGGAPAKNAAATGTASGNTATGTGTTAILFSCVSALITGLTVGTQVWVDLQQDSITGGNAVPTACQVEVFEAQF
jgi:hypothetical protein